MSWGFDQAQAAYDNAYPSYLDAPACAYEDEDGPCHREGEVFHGDGLYCPLHHKIARDDAPAEEDDDE